MTTYPPPADETATVTDYARPELLPMFGVEHYAWILTLPALPDNVDDTATDGDGRSMYYHPADGS